MSTLRVENINQSSEAVYSYLNENSHVFIPPLKPRVDVLAYAQKIAAHAQQFWLYQSERAVGFAACYFNDPANITGFITSISVISDAQGTGAGTLLLNEVIRYAQEKRTAQIRLEVFEENEHAIVFYKRKGFQVVGNVDQKLIMNLEVTANATN
jgi:ribosomal protein S18 acetylase RimI-like enzyme